MAIDFQQLAKDTAAKIGTGIDWRIIYSQWRLESGDFTNWGSTVANNPAGMKQFKDNPAGINATSPEGDNYQVFNSWEDFSDYYARYISKYFPDAAKATTTTEYATALKGGGYFGGDLNSYIKNLASKYADSDTNITSDESNIYAPSDSESTQNQTKTATSNQGWTDKIITYLGNATTRVLKVIAGFVLLTAGLYLMLKAQPQVVINKTEKEE